MTDAEMDDIINLMLEYLLRREIGIGWPLWPGDNKTTTNDASQGWRVYGQLVAMSEGVYLG